MHIALKYFGELSSLLYFFGINEILAVVRPTKGAKNIVASVHISVNE